MRHAAAVVGIAAVLGGLYGLKERTTAFWLPERSVYLEQYREAVRGREQRLLQWLRADDRDEVQRQRTLAEKIADANYQPLSANTPHIDSATLIILGDVHTQMDRQLNLLLPELVQQGDRVLIEQPPDRHQVIDLSAYGTQPTPAAPDRIAGNVEEMLALLQRISETVRGIKAIEERVAFVEWASPEHGKFIQLLAAEGTGTVVPIDAQSALRDAYLSEVVQYSVLKSAVFHLKGDASQLHPFEQWMVYEDLGIAVRGSGANAIGQSAVSYVKRMPNTDFNRERQEQIIDNVLEQVGELRDGERAVLVIGSAHLDRIAPTLLDALQEARVPYVAFTPDTQRMFRTPVAAQTANWNYLELLLEDYLAVRTTAGSPPYRGTVAGMAGRFAKAFAKQ